MKATCLLVLLVSSALASHGRPTQDDYRDAQLIRRALARRIVSNEAAMIVCTPVFRGPLDRYYCEESPCDADLEDGQELYTRVVSRLPNRNSSAPSAASIHPAMIASWRTSSVTPMSASALTTSTLPTKILGNHTLTTSAKFRFNPEPVPDSIPQMRKEIKNRSSGFYGEGLRSRSRGQGLVKSW